MAFPVIQFKGTNVTIEQKWQDLVEQKFSTLGKYIGNETDVTCQVEFEKEASHQNGPIHRIEANLFVAGKLFRAETVEESFELAIDVVRQELDRELAKTNEKKETLLKRGGRKVKDMLRFGRV
jgi:ribosomal subunit interface protein